MDQKNGAMYKSDPVSQMHYSYALCYTIEQFCCIINVSVHFITIFKCEDWGKGIQRETILTLPYTLDCACYHRSSHVLVAIQKSL